MFHLRILALVRTFTTQDIKTQPLFILKINVRNVLDINAGDPRIETENPCESHDRFGDEETRLMHRMGIPIIVWTFLCQTDPRLTPFSLIG